MTSAPPEKTPLLHARSTDYVEITYKMTSFWTAMYIQPHQVKINAACSSKMRSLPNTLDVAKQDNTIGWSRMPTVTLWGGTWWCLLNQNPEIALQFRGPEVNKRNDLHQRVTHKYTAAFTKDTGFL